MRDSREVFAVSMTNGIWRLGNFLHLRCKLQTIHPRHHEVADDKTTSLVRSRCSASLRQNRQLHLIPPTPGSTVMTTLREGACLANELTGRQLLSLSRSFYHRPGCYLLRRSVAGSAKRLNIYNPSEDGFIKVKASELTGGTGLNNNFINCLLTEGDTLGRH